MEVVEKINLDLTSKHFLGAEKYLEQQLEAYLEEALIFRGGGAVIGKGRNTFGKLEDIPWGS